MINRTETKLSKATSEENYNSELDDIYTPSEETYNLFTYEIDPKIYKELQNVSVSP